MLPHDEYDPRVVPVVSEAQLQQIRERLQASKNTSPRIVSPKDADALLAEVERLKAIDLQQREWIAQLMDEQPRYATKNAALTTENARMREIVQWVADDHMHKWDAVDPQEVWACEVCHIDSQDYAEEVQAKARAILAESEQ